MNKKNAPTKNKIFISNLISNLPNTEIEDMQFNNTQTNLSQEKIKQLAMKKREKYMENIMNNPIKKAPKKFFTQIIVAAVIVSTLSVTAFAFSQSDMMKNLFGGKTDVIDTVLQTPVQSKQVDGKTMSINSILTDDYVTNIIVSIKGAKKIDENKMAMDENAPPLFDIKSTNEMKSFGYSKLEKESNKEVQYFRITLTNKNPSNNADITITLSKDIAPITLTTKTTNSLESATINFPENVIQGGVTLDSLHLSPMGFILKSNKNNIKNATPGTDITLVFNDNTTEKLEVESYNGDDVFEGNVGEGGGVIIGEDSEIGPLVTSYTCEINDNGAVSQSGEFARIIDTKNIKEVIINDVAYPVSK